MRNCEDVDLSGKVVGPLNPDRVNVRLDGHEDRDPPEGTLPCFGRFRWLNGYDKGTLCKGCDYFGRCYLKTFLDGRDLGLKRDTGEDDEDEDEYDGDEDDEVDASEVEVDASLEDMEWH